LHLLCQFDQLVLVTLETLVDPSVQCHLWRQFDRWNRVTQLAL
jgi:hypothetical protein